MYQITIKPWSLVTTSFGPMYVGSFIPGSFSLQHEISKTLLINIDKSPGMKHHIQHLCAKLTLPLIS
jgi:hypothetical protein